MNKYLFLILCGIALLMPVRVCAAIQGDTLLVKQACEAAKAEDYQKALELFLQADKTFAPDTTDYYGNIQHNIGYVYYMLGDKKHAAVYWERALKVFPQFSEKNELLLEPLASIYMELEDQANFMRIMKLIEEHNKNELTEPCTTFKDYFERAQYYESVEDMAKAKEHYLQALAIAKDATPKEQEDVYAAYAKYLSANGDRSAAADYYQLAADVHKVSKGEDKTWSLLVYMIALNRQLLQDWTKGYVSYSLAYKVFERTNDYEYMARCQHGMGTCQYFQGEYSQAKDCYSREVSILGKVSTSSAPYAKALEYVAKADVKLKNYDTAIATLEKAADIYEKLGDQINLQSVLSELNSTRVKSGKGYGDEVEAHSVEAATKKNREILAEERRNLPAYKLLFGEDGINYAQTLGLVAELTYQLEDKTEGVKEYRNYLETERRALRRAFVLQSEKERQYIWSESAMLHDSLMATVCDVDAQAKQLGDSINALAYDLQLLSKGILLNSSIEFGKVLTESGNSQLIADFEKVKELDSEVQALQAENAEGEKSAQIASLRQESARLMLTLMRQCSELKDFTEYLDYRWTDVRAALADGDVAIEFAEIKNGVVDSENLIVALVVTKEMTAPNVVQICSRRQASRMAADTLFCSNTSYADIVWGKLFPYISHAKRIYFSADAEFSGIGIEYLPYNGKPLIDHCEVYRLSSTKELCRNYSALPLKGVALFGGIEYGNTGHMKTTNWRQMDGKGNETTEQTRILNYSPLKGTGEEVAQIKSVLQAVKGCHVDLYDGTKASEEQVRKLSGCKDLNVLHIATHGQYIGGNDVTETEAMNCSLLALSGANEPIEMIENDGILYAQDVADMNFRNCRLAVLSACETGLGLLSGDGVFGLQRGFKNAGVRTLLMSLSKVDDAATTQLMVQFYKALAANNALSPNAALRQAQQYMRANGYSDPRLWASFIILDGQ